MEEASLRKIAAVLRARWILILAIALPILAGSTAYAFTRPPAYTAEVVMMFAPGDGTESGSAFARMLTPYEIAATNEETIAKAEAAAGLETGSLRDRVSSDLPSNDIELTVDVTTDSPERSAAAIRSIISSVSDEADGDPDVDLWNTSEIRVTGDETPLRRAVILIAGLVLSIAPGTVFALVREGNRPRARLPEDMRAAGLPVLQSVPRHRISRMRRSSGGAPRSRLMVRLWLPVLWELSRVSTPTLEAKNEIVVASVNGCETEAGLIAANLEVMASASLQSPRGRSATFRSAPWDALPSAADRDVRMHAIVCILVVRAGCPMDELRTVFDVVRGQGGRIVGGVFLGR